MIKLQKHKKTMLIFDGRHLLWRTNDAFSDLFIEKDKKMIRTGGIYGFLNVSMNVYRKYSDKCNINRVIVAWEGKDNFRYKLYPQYKQRKNTDYELLEEMRDQEIRVKAILRRIGIEQYKGIKCEADDVIGTLAEKQTKRGNKQVIIYSGDSDLRQLISYYTMLVSPIPRGKEVEHTTSSIFDKYGFPPDYIADLKALAGDQSDNIPGVEGIGEKTAIKLIAKYGHIKDIIKAAKDKNEKEWPVSDRFKKKIIESKKLLKLYKKLTTIDRYARIKEIKTKRNQKKLIQWLKYYKFYSLNTYNEVKTFMEMGVKK